MEDLENKYQQKHSEYEAAITTKKPASKIQALNKEVAAIVTQMLVVLGETQAESAELKLYRDRLTQKLTNIQNEYTALSTERDAAQTVKDMRTYQESTFNGVFFWYMFGLIVASLLFVAVLFYKVKTIPVMTPSPSSMAPFT